MMLTKLVQQVLELESDQAVYDIANDKHERWAVSTPVYMRVAGGGGVTCAAAFRCVIMCFI